MQFIRVEDLNRSSHEATLTAPKGATEGSEVQICWPARVADASGTVEEVNRTQIRYRTANGFRKVLLGSRGGRQLLPQVSVGEHFPIGRILAANVPIRVSSPCPGGADASTFLTMLNGRHVADRYAAAKALRASDAAEVSARLANRMRDEREDVYVTLEAASGLLLRNDERSVTFFENLLARGHDSHRLEAVIVLAEVPRPVSATLLRSVLRDEGMHSDIRSAAAWALGEISFEDSIGALIDAFHAFDAEIRREAARALSKIAKRFRQTVVAQFPTSEPTEQRPGVAWALGRGGVQIPELIPTLVDDNARRWVSYMIGTQDRSSLADVEALRAADPEVYFAVTVLWTILESWIRDFNE